MNFKKVIHYRYRSRNDVGSVFRIPKNYKPVYARRLQVPDDASEEIKELAADIKFVKL